MQFLELIVQIPFLLFCEYLFDKLVFIYDEGNNSFFILIIRYFIFAFTFGLTLILLSCLSFIFNVTCNILFNLKKTYFKVACKLIILVIQPFTLTYFTSLFGYGEREYTINVLNSYEAKISNLMIVTIAHFSFALIKIIVYNDIHMNALFYKYDFQNYLPGIKFKKVTIFHVFFKAHNYLLLTYSIVSYFFPFFPFNIIAIDSISLLIYDAKKNYRAIEIVANDFCKDKSRNEILTSFFNSVQIQKTLLTSECVPHYTILKLAIFIFKYTYGYCSTLSHDHNSLFRKACSFSNLLNFQYESITNGFSFGDSTKRNVCLNTFLDHSFWTNYQFCKNFENGFLREFLLNFSKTGLSIVTLGFLLSCLFYLLGYLVFLLINGSFSISSIQKESLNKLNNTLYVGLFFHCYLNGTWFFKDNLRIIEVYKGILQMTFAFSCLFNLDGE